MTGPVEPSPEGQEPHASPSGDRSDTDNVIPLRRPLFDEDRVALLMRLELPDGIGENFRLLLDATVDGQPMTPEQLDMVMSSTAEDWQESARRHQAVLDATNDRIAAWAVLEQYVVPIMELDGLTLAAAARAVLPEHRDEVNAALAVLADEDGYLRPPPWQEGA